MPIFFILSVFIKADASMYFGTATKLHNALWGKTSPLYTCALLPETPFLELIQGPALLRLAQQHGSAVGYPMERPLPIHTGYAQSLRPCQRGLQAGDGSTPIGMTNRRAHAQGVYGSAAGGAMANEEGAERGKWGHVNDQY